MQNLFLFLSILIGYTIGWFLGGKRRLRHNRKKLAKLINADLPDRDFTLTLEYEADDEEAADTGATSDNLSRSCKEVSQ